MAGAQAAHVQAPARPALAEGGPDHCAARFGGDEGRAVRGWAWLTAAEARANGLAAASALGLWAGQMREAQQQEPPSHAVCGQPAARTRLEEVEAKSCCHDLHKGDVVHRIALPLEQVRPHDSGAVHRAQRHLRGGSSQEGPLLKPAESH